MINNKKYYVHLGFMLLAACAVWLAVWRKETFTGTIVSNGIQLAASFYTMMMMFRAYRLSNKQSKLWLFFGLGMLDHTIAQLGWTSQVLLTGSEPLYLGFPGYLWLLYYGFIIIGIYYQYRDRLRSAKIARGFIIEILLLVAVASTLYWKLQLERLFIQDNHIPNEVIGYMLANSSANAVVIFLLLYLSLTGRSGYTSLANRLLLLGFILRLAGNTMFIYFLPGINSWINDVCWLLGTLMTGFAALPELDRRVHADAATAPEGSFTLFLRRYGLILIVNAALIVMICYNGKLTILSVGAILTIVLLVVRLTVGIYELESTGAALIQTDINYRNFVESSLFGVFIEQEGRLVYVNQQLESTFGVKSGQMLGKPLADYIAVMDRTRLKEQFLSIADVKHSTRLSVKAIGAHQSELFLELQASGAFYEGQPAISGTLLDVTESKLSEQRMIRSEKLSVVGQLAAGVAHEIRNPLTALKGFTQLLHKSAGGNQRYYEMMLTELERINYIVGEFNGALAARPVEPACSLQHGAYAGRHRADNGVAGDSDQRYDSNQCAAQCAGRAL
ncbi:PAS domain S-box protein [Paenibacillus sp. PR3]|uniref:histidine kinase n=1 Tax=Paenibacillus terricola TaxID=2763503 RepID=A0ABR8N008_9BACL|nr:PAS domain-containing sensor histidine kinase [Paenibacillus terricola]MBD3920535.1 PAS domain S-box protein [Paenibacillus terricola]